MSATAQAKMVKARTNLVMAHPFFGTLALRMKMVADPKAKRASTDGSTLWYNPEAVDKLPLSKVQGMIAHTILHPGFLHHTRRGNRDYGKWQKACDHSINHILKDAGFDLPEGTFCDPQYKGMSAEHIYTLIPDDPKNDGGASGGAGGGAGGGGSESNDDSDNDPNNQGNDPGGDGEVKDSPNSTNKGASSSQQNNEEGEWKIAVSQAAHVAKQAGKLPGLMERMLEELLEPVMPWKSILQRFMNEKCNDDFSWARGNRRFLAQGLYLPSRQADEAMGAMVVTIDTSGSITDKLLQEFGSEIKGIHTDLRPRKLIVIYCDADVNHVDEFGPDDELFFKMHGGGGTDFRPPFRWMEDNRVDARCFVYLTDGYGEFPNKEADFPVMWCINNYDVTPPWGEHLVIETEG